MEAWSSLQRCHLNPHVWDLPCVCFNSHGVLSPASSSGLQVRSCLQPSPRGGGECNSQTLETSFLEISSTLVYSPRGSRGPCSCATSIPCGSISYFPYGEALSYLHISVNVLPQFSLLQCQTVMRPPGLAHLAGVCSLLYLFALLP